MNRLSEFLTYFDESSRPPGSFVVGILEEYQSTMSELGNYTTCVCESISTRFIPLVDKVRISHNHYDDDVILSSQRWKKKRNKRRDFVYLRCAAVETPNETADRTWQQHQQLYSFILISRYYGPVRILPVAYLYWFTVPILSTRLQPLYFQLKHDPRLKFNFWTNRE